MMDSVLGLLVAALVMMLGIRTYTVYETAADQNTIATITASEWQQMNTAATSYIQANSTAIEGVATATTPATITVAMLQAPTVNLLPASFSPTNPYGQSWEVLVLQPSAGVLQSLVMTTGGTTLKDKQLNQIANLVGVQGGFIPDNDSTLYSAGAVYGVGSAWQVSEAGYTGAAPGHLAALLMNVNGQTQSAYLYRNAVPGQPQLNTMNTPLIMSATEIPGNACSPLGAIAQDGSGNVLDCPSSGVWTTVGGGSWKSPVATYAALPLVGNTAGDARMVTGLSRAFTWNGVAWVALAVDQNGNLTVPGNVSMNTAQLNAVATVGAACIPNGLVAQNGSGALLSCQSGVWAAAQGSGQGITPGNWCPVGQSCGATVGQIMNGICTAAVPGNCNGTYPAGVYWSGSAWNMEWSGVDCYGYPISGYAACISSVYF